MKWIGNLRKMSTVPAEELEQPIQYLLEGKDVLDDLPSVPLNEFIGREIAWRFEGVIHCVVTGDSMVQPYRMGMSQEAFSHLHYHALQLLIQNFLQFTQEWR